MRASPTPNRQPDTEPLLPFSFSLLAFQAVRFLASPVRYWPPDMAIKTLDTTNLAAQTGNLYETVSILSKRSRQLSAKTKAELDQKLSFYEEISLDPAEELRSNEDQLRISLEYERKPKPEAVAIQELEEGELYFRNPNPDA